MVWIRGRDVKHPGVGRHSKARVAYTGRKRNMKKVTRKGAYKKSVKNQMSIRRAPIVETKQRVHSDIATLNGFPVVEYGTPGHVASLQPANWQAIIPTDAYTLLPLRSFYRNSHGFEEYNCAGNSIFSKYLNARVQLRFPNNGKLRLPVPASENPQDPDEDYEAENHMIQNPTKVYLICGWVTQNWNCPIEGEDIHGNIEAGSRPSRSKATQAQLLEYITRNLKPYFDDSTDKLMFREKETSNIKIDKYVQFKPNLDNAIGTQASPETPWSPVEGSTTTIMHATGSIPDVQRNWSVKTGRKIHLTEGFPYVVGDAPMDTQNLYPNHTWLPFMVIYNPSFQAQLESWVNSTEQGQEDRFTKVVAMQYRYNDAHYFTDS